MRSLVLAMVLASTPALGQSGFFSGGYADGMRSANEYDLQRRALELDALDGGNRYYRLRTEQQMDALERQLRQNNEYLESLRREQRIRRGY